MAGESLMEMVQSLTAEEQAAVRQFIDYLKVRGGADDVPASFVDAAEEFIAQHPELLRRLAL
ncbi:MAG: hypothetical protein J0L64_26270 [Acidobacteria bacterium]|nr:hypothetical protein [Acidobacteriota bacterium]